METKQIKEKIGGLKRESKRTIGKLIGIILIVIVLIGAGYVILWKTGYLETLRIAKQLQEQKQLSKEDKAVLDQLKTIMDLPEDTTPMMALINDADKLREEQPDFFEKAKYGDRLVIYPDMAIIYDYSANKIIHVGPVSLGDQQAVAKVPFALYNGTNDPEALNKFETKLTTTYNNAETIMKGNAVGNYDKTLVIDLVGNNPEIQKIAEALGGEVASLPEGETAPEGAIILIIVGADQEQ